MFGPGLARQAFEHYSQISNDSNSLEFSIPRPDVYNLRQPPNFVLSCITGTVSVHNSILLFHLDKRSLYHKICQLFREQPLLYCT